MKAGIIVAAGLTAGAIALAGSPLVRLAEAALGGDSHTVSVKQSPCEDRDWGDMERACEVREITIEAPRGTLTVDGGNNGGVKVFGESRRDVQLVAEVWASARDYDRAEELMEQVSIHTDGGTIESDGPETGRRESWGVSWRLSVPHQTDLDLQTHNGGITISDVDGEVRFDALNGGVSLTGMAGDVRGSTVNGGLHVELDGDEWDGAGLDVETTNGGVKLDMSETYSANIEASTVNGRINTEIAMEVSGRISKSIRAQLGDGGAPIRVETTNGSVQIRAN